jgi:hypothetical protein
MRTLNLIIVALTLIINNCAFGQTTTITVNVPGVYDGLTTTEYSNGTSTTSICCICNDTRVCYKLTATPRSTITTINSESTCSGDGINLIPVDTPISIFMENGQLIASGLFQAYINQPKLPNLLIREHLFTLATE